MSAHQPFTILCVDDNADARRSTAIILETEGYATCEAANGSEALDLVGEADLVILDVHMPDLDGFEVCRRLRANPATALVPIILLSGHYTGSNDMAQALEGGGDVYLTKPIEPQVLLGQVKTLLRVRQAEVVLQQQARVFDLIHDAVVTTDLEGRVSRWNRGAERLFGYSAGEMLGQHVGLLDSPREHGSDVQEVFAAVRAQGKYEGERWIRQKSGEERFVHTSLSLLPGGRSQEAGVVGCSIDITARKRAEERLQASEERYRQIVETAAEGIWIINPAGKTVFVNQRMAQMLRSTPEEMQAQNLGAFTDEEGLRRIEARILQHEMGQEQQHEFRFRRRDGSVFWGLVTTSFLRDQAGVAAGALLMVTDITERKSLEQQFLQSQKMEAVGRLAGGVAHDFNNLLTIISGYSELLLNSLAGDDPARGVIGQIMSAGERAASLTRQLLAFSRKTVLEPRVLDLNALLREMVTLLRRLIGEDIELTTSLSPDLFPVCADPGQLEHAVINLAINARDAMPQGGRLTIATANVLLDASDVEATPDVRPGPYVLLSVSDTGHGMDEPTRTRIFEPFFTTKPEGKGTGLGLAMVYGFVKQSGGHVSVHSEPGRGATFRLFLPRLEAAGPSSKSDVRSTRVPRGSETILLVEDEESVRALARYILQGAGYTVLTASNGKEAFRIAERHDGPIHLLVTDVVMPLLSGRQVAEGLRATRKEIKVLYTSGYTDDAVVRHGIREAEVAFLQKPFTPASLTEKVRQVLDQPAQ